MKSILVYLLKFKPFEIVCLANPKPPTIQKNTPHFCDLTLYSAAKKIHNPDRKILALHSSHFSGRQYRHQTFEAFGIVLQMA
jgi:hypothetical protein